MDKPKVTPKDFFLWAGAMIALYTCVVSFISLLFSYIDFAYPDALNSYVDPYSSGMRASIASLIVLFPLFLFLMRVMRKGMIADPSRKEVWVRRWALVFTIFVAGFAIAVDLITLINYFLGGDVTTRFFLKVAVVLLVAGAGLMHFLADLKGFWDRKPQQAMMVGWAVGVLILVSIAAGFFIMGSPGQVRLYRFDDQKVSDLQTIQYQVVNFWQQKGVMPSSVDDLIDPLSGYMTPVDPQGGMYTYELTGPMSFKLCATFNAETQPTSPTAQRTFEKVPVPAGMDGAAVLESSTWVHGAGITCFTRTIDPERYPPYNKK